MPEQITKHPEVTLQVLKSAGAKCGEGLPQQILTRCPAERFCALPGGEMCVYGLEQIPQMTQITRKELAGLVCEAGPKAAGTQPEISAVDVAGMASTFMLGIVAGAVWGRRRKTHG